eukprot:GHRQ01001915.1.p1 GENE.GHRQ01001915.1~~GHRQ01001915.1.p1  ORF type:complete len:223 (+),score=125.11 GHRQ01001915.1:145-813(+)
MGNKATPKASITLVEKADDGWKFARSPSAAGDFSLKHNLGKKLTLGVGFTDNTVRKIKSIPGLVLSADLQARKDLKLSISHNISNNASKLGFTHDRFVGGKKNTLKLNFLTKTRSATGELITALAANKKATLAFTEKQVTNVKIALLDDVWTYEPSYNLVKKAPSLAISRPLHGGKYKLGWNLKTDDLSLEYSYQALKFVAFKSPSQPVPRIAASFEHDLEF